MYPGHHFGAVPIELKDGTWKCSGCGFKPPITPENRQAVSAHITMKLKWEKRWEICPSCKGTGKVKRGKLLVDRCQEE